MPDVNILIYGHRVDDPTHLFYRKWLEDLLNSPSPFGLSVLVASAFVRVLTHPRFPPAPSELEQAIAFIEILSSAPNCRLLGVGPENWRILRDLCRKAKTSGSHVSDAQHAAIAIEHGCTLVSRDPDFNRFTRYGLDFDLLEPN